METYNILKGKKIVSTVNVNNIEHALEAAADFAAANNIQSKLKVVQVKSTVDLTEEEILEEITEQIIEETNTTEK